MNRGRTGAVLAALAFASAGVLGHTYYVLQDEVLCDATGQLCLRGWIVHDPHDNRIQLSARVQESSVPGKVTIRLVGETPGKHRVSTALVFDVRGNYSEIVEANIIPEWPFETLWQVEGLYFEVAEE
ncbi:MAG: hypothetical protein ACREVN_05895 [Gammaproteobacteria bacterium]